MVILAIGLFGLVSCNGVSDPSPEPDFTYEFDDSASGWNSHGIDLMVGGEEVNWAVEHTPDTGHAEPGAMRFYLNNRSDAGKIWMEREFSLEPDQTYEVEVRYAFGTNDYGINLWTIIAGVHREPPETQEELTFQGETGVGSDEDLGMKWLDKRYTFTAVTDADGELYVALGIWGTWETPRTYYIDDVRIDFRQQ